MTNQQALQHQVGGDHYKKLKIQPIEFCMANELNACETAIVKYISRWREKGGVQDLEKIKHYVDLLIQLDPRLRGDALIGARSVFPSKLRPMDFGIPAQYEEHVANYLHCVLTEG